jgi:hypothetical protein
MNKKKMLIGKEYILIGSLIIGSLISFFSSGYIFNNFDNPFSGSLTEFSSAIDKQPWQNYFLGNILGNLGASFLMFFLLLVEYPSISVFISVSFFSYKILIKLLSRKKK